MGTVTLSVDAELGWGWHDLDSPPNDRIEAARQSWQRLQGLLSEFSVPATWAIVGHLLLDDCDGRHQSHPAGVDWFERETGEWRERPDLRFGGELVNDLQTARVDHDIGSHTFSHVPLSSDKADRETARAELERSVETAANYGLSMKSFVYPRNRVGHRDLLVEYGFTTYRGNRPKTWVDENDTLGTVAKLVRGTVPGTGPPVVDPVVDEFGLVNIPASLYLFGFEGRARSVAEAVYADPMVLKARHGIDAAADDDGVFHMWLHPNNLVDERDFARMRAILSYVDDRRRAGDVTVATMATVADEVRKRVRA
ncbi:polysaccharide deacetylase family protein [Salinibaculum salinum]|uniref:polysaccharide deacetylase family protein n=1 Tax=Salinibaculum salinum TaxID=3131996 RepID=UPI0030EF1AD1